MMVREFDFLDDIETKRAECSEELVGICDGGNRDHAEAFHFIQCPLLAIGGKPANRNVTALRHPNLWAACFDICCQRCNGLRGCLVCTREYNHIGLAQVADRLSQWPPWK